MCEPMYPAPPVTRIFIICSSSNDSARTGLIAATGGKQTFASGRIQIRNDSSHSGLPRVVALLAYLVAAPRLSIITINRNNATGLHKTLSSLVNQTYQNWESIVIDGASSDESMRVVDSFQNRIAYKVSERDSGIYNAMNKGVRQARGEYCLFLNSGDSLPADNTFEEIMAYGPRADIVYGDILIYDGETTILGKMPEHLNDDLFVERELWHQSFIRRDLFSRFGMYDERFKYAADYAFYLHTVVKNRVSTQYVPVPFAVFDTFGEGSNPKNREAVIAERAFAKKEYLSAWQLWWNFRLRYVLLHKVFKPLIKKIFGAKLYTHWKTKVTGR